MAPRNIITETTAEAYVAQVLGPKLETIEENIKQTKLDQKTALSTMITFTESMTQSFEEMKNTKATEVPVSLCKTEAVKTIVREQVTEALKELDLKAEVSPESSQQMNEQIEKMKEIAKRPPLLSLHLNLTAKAFGIVAALLFFSVLPDMYGLSIHQCAWATNSTSHMQGSTTRTREQDIPQHTV